MSKISPKMFTAVDAWWHFRAHDAQFADFIAMLECVVNDDADGVAILNTKTEGADMVDDDAEEASDLDEGFSVPEPPKDTMHRRAHDMNEAYDVLIHGDREAYDTAILEKL